MTKPTSDARNFWIGLIALLLVGLFLAVRTERGVSMVTATRPDAPIAKDAEAASQRALLADLDAKAARVRTAIAGERDPFRDPPVFRSEAASADAAPARPAPPPRVPPPGLRAVVYDQVNPSVQLSSGARTSDWLHQGDIFQGWKIEKIESKSVTVSRNGEIAVLRPS
jgi:hypothetical protein